MGLGSLLIEGGGITITGFLEAGLLDRLQVSIAPLIIGSGPQGLTSLSEAGAVVLETSGELSVLRDAGPGPQAVLAGVGNG